MKFLNSMIICLTFLFTEYNFYAQSAIYVGGPSYYDDNFSIDELKNSGFSNVIIFTIHINELGDLNLNGEFLICKDGEYVGNDKYPEFAKNMSLLKTAPTSISRLEFCLSAWGSTTFANIKSLLATQGSDSGSVLYKNFKALKENIPAIDAINFDDESTYDEPSSTEFAVMLYDLGYQISLVPYTQSTYWKNLAKNTNIQRKGAVDLVYLQCYAGGAGNSPCDWQPLFENIPVIPGVWGSQMDLASIESEMIDFRDNCNSKGGFIWIYDQIKNTDKVELIASTLNNVFDISYDLYATISNPQPEPNQIEILTNSSISWVAGDSAVSHNVYFGKTVNPEFIGNQLNTEYTPNFLEENTRYFWRVDEITNTDTIVGNTFTFHTVYPLPGIVSNPSPENGAIDVSHNQSFSWKKDNYATSYIIYLGEQMGLSESDKVSEQKENVFVPTEPLKPNTNYYWRVDSKNATGITTGETWNFTTKDSITQFSGYALSFDGNKSQVTIPNSTNLSVSGNQITLEAWIYPTEFKPETWQGSIVNKDYTGGAGKDYGYGLRCGGQGQFDVVLGGGNWQELKSAQNTVPLNTWSHIAATYDGSYIRLFFNGDEISNRRVTFNIVNNANNVMIGNSPGFPGRVFNGLIDEVRIWKIARTSEEIKSGMNTNLGNTILSSENSGLVGYWNFDEGEEQLVNDLSFFNNNGVLGSTSFVEASDPTWAPSEVIVGVEDNLNTETKLPEKFELYQNYPNPFNPSTVIKFSVPKKSFVSLKVFDVTGSLVKILMEDNLSAGSYEYDWNAQNLSSGIYLIRLSTKTEIMTIKTMLLK